MAVGTGGSASLRPRAPFVRLEPRQPFGVRAVIPPDLPTSSPATAIAGWGWWRSFATCLALSAAALALAPGLEPVAGATAPRLDSSERRQLAALSISPLQDGARSGRRMAPGEAVRSLDHVPERPRIQLVATAAAGDTLPRVLQRAGVAAAEARRVSALLAPLVSTPALAGGTRIDLTLGRRATPYEARPIDALAFRARFDLRVAVARTAAGLQLRALPIGVDTTPLRIQGISGASLYRAARAAGAPAGAVQDYLRALAERIDVGLIGPADRFDLIVEHRRAVTGESETGRVLYAGLVRASGERLQLLRWERNGESRWFDVAGAGQTSGGTLQRPVPGTVSSAFGWRRHPILGFTRLHKGMDFRAGYGTPILAATDGQVVRAGWAGGYGKQVRLAHDGGFATSYSHMSRILAQPGDLVRQGQVIGYVGSTGLSTGPHLHYELLKDGVAIDPAAAQFTTRATIAGPELQAFRARLAQLLGTRVAG